MLRSLLAVVAAVLAGFVIAKSVEGLALAGAAPMSPAHLAGLAAGWAFGAFAAAAIALLIGRRWAPLAHLSAASLSLNAIVTLLPAAAPIWFWPAALALTTGGGMLAARLLKAQSAHPDASRKGGLL